MQDVTLCAVPRIGRLFQEISEHIQLHELRPVIHARQRRVTYGGHGRSCMRLYLDSDQILAIADQEPGRYVTKLLALIRDLQMDALQPLWQGTCVCMTAWNLLGAEGLALDAGGQTR